MIKIVSRSSFEFQNIIGKGGFGKVWKVLEKKTNKFYALKEMSKLKIMDKKSEKSIKYERELLSHLKNPFIVNMYYAFQDYDNLYLVMDLLSGGDLRYHICRHTKFSEEETKFFICNIILGLEYIHNKRVIHRDIKPENLVLDNNGYIRITDFGISKIFSNNNNKETSGTPGYMSPEVMQGKKHNKAVDYFALGVIGYECMMGKRPYIGKSRKEIKEQMIMKQIIIKNEDIPNGWSQESKDFINKLLIRKPEKRLGYGKIIEVKNDNWIKCYPWEKLKSKKIIAPFIPENKDNYDKRYCNNIEKIGIKTKQRYEDYMKSQSYQNVFANFTYYPMLDDNENINKNNICYKKFNYKMKIQNNDERYKNNNAIMKKRCHSASIGGIKINYNSNNDYSKNKFSKLNYENSEKDLKRIEPLIKPNKLYKTKSFNKTNNNNNKAIKNSSLIRKHLSFHTSKTKNNSLSKGNKNSFTNIKIHNEQKSSSNPFLNYHNLKKLNLIDNALNNLRENSAYSQTLRHIRNHSSQNNQSKSKENFSISKISINTKNYSQGKNDKYPKENSNRKNGIIGLEIKRIKNISKKKTNSNRKKKYLTDSNSVNIFKVSSNSHNSTGSNSSCTNNYNLKNKTISP